MSLLIKIIFPLVISLFARIIIEKTKLKKSTPIDKIIYTATLSISTFIIAASYLGLLLQDNLSTALISLFGFALALFIFSLPLIYQDIRGILSTKLAKHEKVIAFFLLLLVIKITTLYTYRPVVDADIVATYLPFARSIFINDKLPQYDLYTGNEVTNPPIGGPILFATTYAISGNYLDENFIYYTLPFLLIMALIAYKLTRGLTTRFFSLISAFLFLSLPAIDILLLEGILYPDIIMFSLGTSVLYIATEKLFQNKQLNKLYFAILALSISSMILLKYQGIFIAYVAIVYIFSKIINQKLFHNKLILLLLLLLPFIARTLNIPGVTRISFGGINPLDGAIFLALIPLMYFLLKDNLHHKVKASSISIFLLISLLSIGWFVRNKILYGGYTISIVPESELVGNFLRSISAPSSTIVAKELRWLSIFLFPAYGVLLLAPKITGIFSALKNRLLRTHLYWSLFLYSITIYYLFHLNIRYVFPILPSVIIISTLGIKFILDKLKQKYHWTKSKYHTIAIILTLLIFTFSLFQSIWLFRVSASIFSPPHTSQLASTELIQSKDSSSPANLTPETSEHHIFVEYIQDHKSSLVDFFEKINSISTIQPSHWLAASFIGVVGFLGLLYLAIIIYRNTEKHIYKAFFVIGALIILGPYLVNIIIISKGNIGVFQKNIESNIITYQGESSYIVPYLQENIGTEDVIIKLGLKSGLAYQLDRQVINIHRRYGLRQLSPVINEQDHIIYNYYRDHNINYILISTADNYSSIRERIGNNSRLLEIATNPQYFTLVIDSNELNQWKLYRRKEI